MSYSVSEQIRISFLFFCFRIRKSGNKEKDEVKKNLSDHCKNEELKMAEKASNFGCKGV